MSTMSNIMNLLLPQLQRKNPEGFQVIQQAMNSGGNPMAMIKQLMGKADPQQIQSILQQAKQFGVPDEVLCKIQNIK